MANTKLIIECLTALFLILPFLSCNEKSENDCFNVAGEWFSEESYMSKTSENDESIRLFFTPDGKFCPLGEFFDMHRFRHYEWTGDSLILTNNNGMKAYYHILSYNDTLFTIVDYPEYGDTLLFNRYSTFTSKEWQEKKWLCAYDFPDDSLDIILENTDQVLPDDSKGIVLSRQQMIKAHSILKNFYNGGYLLDPYYKGISVVFGFPLDLYFRRYIGYRQDGHLKVMVALNKGLGKEEKVGVYDDIKNSEIRTRDDGGPDIGEVYIDLDKNEVEILGIHRYI